MADIPQITVDQVPENAAVLDVREDDEWRAGHIMGVKHIPLAEVPQRLDEIPEADTVYVFCRAGGRSAQATTWLNGNGFNAVNVDGGMKAWDAAGKPMVSEDGSAAAVI
ncbi:rhodanese-like domain-containing protein [Cumulibacter soli]|uniref:rhodanese-like domain-containing protein n=1 Tax=Cumulibacter soli TaxID=2546344 RepID=UPI0010671B0B|nr:rhodanese-like domain-containing protein [Cumulibacter soli]